MDLLALLGTAAGLGLAAGLRLYGVVLAVGLLIRFGWIRLNPQLDSLRALADDKVLVVAGVLFLIEFFADKIPWVDSLWDSVHTIIRPIGGALIGAAAESFDPATRAILFMLAGGVALSSHFTKAGTRLAVNHSPEPFSNIVLSLVEDAAAFGITWLALEHPFLMLGVVAAFLAVFAWVSPKLFRLMRVECAALFAVLRRWFGSPVAEPGREAHLSFLRQRGVVPQAYVRAVAGKGVAGLKDSIGYLCLDDRALHFVARRWFRFRHRPIERGGIASAAFRKQLLMDRLVIETGGRREAYLFFRDTRERAEALANMLAPAAARRVPQQQVAWQGKLSPRNVV